jgi:hypothetical protein
VLDEIPGDAGPAGGEPAVRAAIVLRAHVHIDSQGLCTALFIALPKDETERDPTHSRKNKGEGQVTGGQRKTARRGSNQTEHTRFGNSTHS